MRRATAAEPAFLFLGSCLTVTKPFPNSTHRLAVSGIVRLFMIGPYIIPLRLALCKLRDVRGSSNYHPLIFRPQRVSVWLTQANCTQNKCH